LSSTLLTDQIRTFLSAPRYAVLATSNPDGSIQQSVIWYLLESDTVVMNTAKGRIKYRNMVANPAVSLCVEEGLKFVTLTGDVAMNDDQAVAKADIQRIGLYYDTEEEVRDAYQKNWRYQERVTLTMPIKRVVTHGF
jgi:PPOX class probable F420-dependent enzyme